MAQVEREHVAEAAHARLRGEVEDAVEPGEVEPILGQVDPKHVEPARVLLLQPRVVVVAEAVDPDDLVAGRGEGPGEMRADEPGCSCDPEFHRGTMA